MIYFPEIYIITFMGNVFEIYDPLKAIYEQIKRYIYNVCYRKIHCTQIATISPFQIQIFTYAKA